MSLIKYDVILHCCNHRGNKNANFYFQVAIPSYALQNPKHFIVSLCNAGNRNFKLFDDNGGLIWHKGYLDTCPYICNKQFVIKYSEHMLISKFIYIHAAFIGITPLARV